MELYVFGDGRCVNRFVQELPALYMEAASTFVIVSERSGIQCDCRKNKRNLDLLMVNIFLCELLR